MDVEELFRIAFDSSVPDGRSLDPGAYIGDAVGGRLTGRHGTFNRDFYRGLRGERMGQEALQRHTWSNDGYRLGCIVRAAILMSNGSIGDVSQRDKKRLADALFRMWSSLTLSAIENS